MNGPRFVAVEGWGKAAADYISGDVPSVCIDDAGLLRLLCRNPQAVVTMDSYGRLHGVIDVPLRGRAHGLLALGERLVVVDDTDNKVWICDDFGQGQGELGRPGQFDGPTNAVGSSDGYVLVSDGYRNAKIHSFGANGELANSWGEHGLGPAEFNVVHDLAFHPDGRLFVADSDNDRLQVFATDGTFLTQWTDVQRPRALAVDQDGHVYVGEFPWRSGQVSGRRGVRTLFEPARLSIFSADGALLARWGPNHDDPPGGPLLAPHSLAIDDHGSLYLTEVSRSFSGTTPAPRPWCVRKICRR